MDTFVQALVVFYCVVVFYLLIGDFLIARQITQGGSLTVVKLLNAIPRREASVKLSVEKRV